ncbi:MAG: 50S ribosomal protein L19 [Minisyncoccales bacterium]
MVNHKLEMFVKNQLKNNLPEIRPGDTVMVYQKVLAPAKSAGEKKDKKEKNSTLERHKKIQVFEGQVISRKHGKGISSTITVRKIIDGIGVEKTFPLHSPIIEKIELVKRGKARRAKLYYLRQAKGKRLKLKKETAVSETSLKQ